MDSISREIEVGIAVDKAFSIFVEDINNWWPQEYTWSQEKLNEIKIEGWENGLCTEMGPFNFRCDWGRVTEFVENKRLRIKWQISPNREPVPDPESASDLHLEFVASHDSDSLIKFEHSNFENHKNGAKKYREMMDSENGWDYILKRYKKYCEKKP